MTSLLRPVDLPWPILLHALGVSFVGLSLIVYSPKPSSTELTKATKPAQDSTMLGIATLGIAFGYLLTAYVPQERNTYLYASVPARMMLAGIAGVKLVLGSPARKELLGVFVYDGLGGLVLGWYLGRWDGKIPGY